MKKIQDNRELDLSRFSHRKSYLENSLNQRFTDLFGREFYSILSLELLKQISLLDGDVLSQLDEISNLQFEITRDIEDLLEKAIDLPDYECSNEELKLMESKRVDYQDIKPFLSDYHFDNNIFSDSEKKVLFLGIHFVKTFFRRLARKEGYFVGSLTLTTESIKDLYNLKASFIIELGFIPESIQRDYLAFSEEILNELKIILSSGKKVGPDTFDKFDSEEIPGISKSISEIGNDLNLEFSIFQTKVISCLQLLKENLALQKGEEDLDEDFIIDILKKNLGLILDISVKSSTFDISDEDLDKLFNSVK